MAETILNSPDPVTLVCTGSLTNAATLLSVFPETKTKIEKIVSMGGAMGMGNTSPVAEWNIEIDPEAAKAVYGAGIPFYQVPLNVTHTALVTPEIIERIAEMKTPFADLVVDLMMFFAETYKDVFEFDCPPLHDPLAVAYVICPELFKTKLMNVEIETNSSFCDGCTVCDYYGTTGRPKNATVCLQVDVPQFWELMISSLAKANENSPLNK